jgi:hypothetical protein
MKARSRLKHTAAGLLGSLISRNNDVNGYWAPGMLYRDVCTPPHGIELNLLTCSSEPSSEVAKTVMAYYATFLRLAVIKKGFDWDDLERACVKFQFNVEVAKPPAYYPTVGDPFICSVMLHTVQGQMSTVSAIGRCYPYARGRFRQSTRAQYRD